ncbi:MAG: ribose 5-phosphate isomerase B [bacterium]
MKRILFICTGNVCRSPMAEGLFRDLVKERKDMEASSSGVCAMQGQAPSEYAIAVMKEIGLDISGFRSKSVTRDLVDKSDYIIVMTSGHLDTLLMNYPFATDKVFLLRQFQKDVRFSERDVQDPIGLSRESYIRCRDQIRQALPALLDFILQHEKNPHSANGARLAIGGDHGGFELKANLVNFLKDQNYSVKDFGSFSEQSVDYPDFAEAVSREVLEGRADLGILICKSGVGMSMAANKFPNIRAALVHNVETARLSRLHNNANVLCLSANEVKPKQAREIVKTWLNTKFEGGRHEQRVRKINCLRVKWEANGLAKDSQIFETIENERVRQSENIELIASENFTSRAVMEAQGSCLTNKYAEGYPGKRWYGGCEFVDVIERLAIERAKQLFSAEHANVQPHSGSQANMAVYFSVLKPGDRILTMDLAHGGHLTHGHRMNFSGRFFEVKHYGVSKETETINYDDLAKSAEEFKPRMITAGASAYPRIIDFERMGKIADSVGAHLFVDIAHIAGLVAAGLHPSPIPYADFVTTTTHKTLRGPRGGIIMCRAKFAKEIDSNVFPGVQGGPLMHVIAAKAVCLQEALQPEFKQYQEQVIRNAKALCEGMKKNGYRIVSGATENHLLLVDLQPNDVTGKEAQEALDQAGVTVNKNAIPFDKQPPFQAGGIRLGTPAVTTRGMKEDEMFDIANWIHQAISHRKEPEKLAEIRQQVRHLTSRFPLPA